ncbi:MAG: gamma-glutamylcyclotransferase [Rhodobacteraceae bacterium]|nr:gamma-glutamylcyclotransferase [Paracoccaceae bacterium]
MTHPHFFGYGSLVNRRTHSFDETRPARVKGWRRQWRHTSLREVAYLTVAEAPGHSIDGLIAAVPGGDWAALDEREAAYDRLHLPREHVDHDHPVEIVVQMYRTRSGNDAPPTVRHPILLSYIDTVIAGYLNVFGAEGAERFFTTTDGWESPVLDDRNAPVYPRAVKPTRSERMLVDNALDGLGVRRFRH